MPGVARDGADDPPRLTGPGGPVDRSVQQHVHEAVVHHRQAGTATGDHLLRLDPKQLGEELADRAQAPQTAVVAHIDPVTVGHRGGQVQ